MKTWVHSLFSLILALLLYPIFSWKVIFVFVGGVLIDIDHYFWYVYKYKKFNMFGCYKFFYGQGRKNNFKEINGALFIFHTIEFLLLALLLSFYSELILMVTAGLWVHYVLDLIWHYYVPKRLIVNHSVTSWIVNILKG